MSNVTELKSGFLPVFEKDGHQFIFPFDEYVGEDQEDARKIGIGSLLEAVAYGFKYTFKNVHTDSGISAYVGTLGNSAIRVLPEDWELQAKTEEV